MTYFLIPITIMYCQYIGWWEAARDSSMSFAPSFSLSRTNTTNNNGNFRESGYSSNPSRTVSDNNNNNNNNSLYGSSVELQNRPSGTTSIINPLSRSTTITSSNGAGSTRSSFNAPSVGSSGSGGALKQVMS